MVRLVLCGHPSQFLETTTVFRFTLEEYKGTMMQMRSVLACFLAVWITALGVAQDAAPTALNIEIIEGEGAINNIRQRTAREPIVQVTDENHKPVAGALVLFTAPNRGAGGLFNGARTLSVTTDAQGRAVAQGFQPNAVRGKFQIRVNASYRGVKAERTIAESNVGPLLGLTAKILIITAIAAGVAAGAAIAATSGSSTAKPTVITAGPPTVGAPH